MENLLTGMHVIAALRGDGLLPELARAISKRGSYNDSNACSPSYNAAIATIQQVSEANVGPVALNQETPIENNGSARAIRTPDLLITKQML